MTITEFFKGPYAEILSDADTIMREKMADYGREHDAFFNFKRAAESTGLTPLQVWGVFADKHWGAICRFLRKGATESEPIKGRIADLINYLTLLAGLIEAIDKERRNANPAV